MNTNKFYVFIGQMNTTMGSPHPVTNGYNIYGDLMAFDTRKERDAFYNNVYSRKMYTSIVRTNKNDAKYKFCAGMTQAQYIDYLKFVDFNYVNYDCYNLELHHYNATLKEISL